MPTEVLEQVVAERRASNPGRVIDTEFADAMRVDCDPARIAQLFSNLLGNALAYGAKGKPVTVRASIEASMFELSVANAGPPIPPEAMERPRVARWG